MCNESKYNIKCSLNTEKSTCNLVFASHEMLDKEMFKGKQIEMKIITESLNK